MAANEKCKTKPGARTAAEQWNIFVPIDSKNRIAVVKPDCSVDDLLMKIRNLLGLDDENISQIRVVFAGKEIQYGSGKKLSDFDIKDHSTVLPLIRLEGGGSKQSTLQAPTQLKERELTDLPGYVTVTSLKSEPDMLSLDDDTSKKRAKMPCGHVIGSESITSYCQSLLSAGKFTFNCPYLMGEIAGSIMHPCNREWPYFVVLHVARLTEEEKKTFETKISENYMNKALGIQNCPGCLMWCDRGEINGNRVRCILCTKRNGSPFEFCWACLTEWNVGKDRCQNSECNGVDSRTRILANCPEKDVEGTGQMAPSIRACPKCSISIQHTKACKHMLCYCGFEFCFICLKPREPITKIWKCQPYAICCEVAPRQTVLSRK